MVELQKTATSKWEWPDELDAIAAAPENHRILLENDRVRVLHTTVAVGATTPVHTHRWPSVEYVQSATDFVRRDAQGNVAFDTRADPPLRASQILWSEPFPPHSLENVGDTSLRVIMVELKDPLRGWTAGSHKGRQDRAVLQRALALLQAPRSGR